MEGRKGASEGGRKALHGNRMKKERGKREGEREKGLMTC